MYLKIVNPNTTWSMTRAIERNARSVAGPGVRVEATSPATGPVSIESHYDEAIAVPGLLEEIRRGEADGVDAYVVACFGDPGLQAARELARGPVVGIAESAMRTATYLGRSFSVVTTLSRTIGRARDLTVLYGVDAACAGIRAVEIPVLELDRDPGVYGTIRAGCAEALEQDGSDVVVLGCAGMASLASALTRDLGVPVVDGVTAATVTARGLVDLGLRTSTVGEFAPPPPKAYAGVPAGGPELSVRVGT